MNIQQINYILAVNELKNFGLAADKCCISQSTLSTMIIRFEEEIGISIFDRKSKPVATTKEGEKILGQLKIISKEFDNLNEIIQTQKGEIKGELRIGVIPTVAPYLLPRFLTDFTSKFPKMNFVINEVTTATIIDRITKRELDVGIVSLPLDQPELVEIPLYNEKFVFYDCKTIESDKIITVDKIDFNRLWLLEEGHCMRTQIEKICDLEKYHSENNLKYQSGTIDSLMRFVRMNNGITLLPYLATLEYSDEERSKLSSFESPVPVRTIGLAVHKHFVKKHILELLELEIQDKIIPLLQRDYARERIVYPY